MELNGPFLVIQIPFSFLRSPLSSKYHRKTNWSALICRTAREGSGPGAEELGNAVPSHTSSFFSCII